MQSMQTLVRKASKAKSPDRFDLSKQPGSLPYIWKRVSRNSGAMIGLILLALIIVLCILSPYIMKYDYTAVDMRNRFATPSLEHLFGYDELGRDIMSRIFYGERYPLTIGIGAVAIAAVAGIFIGAVAGYFGGKVDAFLMRVLDVLQSFPGLVSAIAVATVLGTGLVNSIIAIGISFMSQFARLMRANIFAIRDNEFVEAATLMNCSTGRIIMRHLIPNAISPIIVQISMSIAQAALTADGGVTAYPDLKKKKDIVVNAVEAFHLLGYETPKVAILCCKETPDKNMPETMDALALQDACARGELGKCTVVGPISYDLAMSVKRAELKNYTCPYCGDFDILVSPNIHAGNILGKCWELYPGVEMASYVSGARIPIVLTSRAAPAKERLACIALAGIISDQRQ